MQGFNNLGFIPSKSEVQTAKEIWAKTPNVTVKTMLSQFSTECVNCGAGYSEWRLLPPIKRLTGYDIVKYQCKCGFVFRKIENGGE